MKIKTKVRAGGIIMGNHNVTRPPMRPIAFKIKTKTKVRAGGIIMGNHNITRSSPKIKVKLQEAKATW